MAHKTGLEDYYITKNNKKLRFGYTTGSMCGSSGKRRCRNPSWRKNDP
mgnify:CR=1 FL=1